MELNIDFDEFKKHIQNRENAKVLLGANSILMFPYRIFGDILFEKNKITISLVQAGSASPTYIFKRTEFKNTISVNFKFCSFKLSEVKQVELVINYDYPSFL